MKYDFQEPIKNNLTFKINGGDPKKWILGVPAAAEQCNCVALKMCLEVYLLSCVTSHGVISMDDAVKVLSDIGFAHEDILDEAGKIDLWPFLDNKKIG
jgi:hypothetical protein